LEYARTLQRFLEFKDSLQRIPVHKPEDVAMPYWQNGFLMGLDPVSLYCDSILLLASRIPRSTLRSDLETRLNS
jgi:hypothetical protein